MSTTLRLLSPAPDFLSRHSSFRAPVDPVRSGRKRTFVACQIAPQSHSRLVHPATGKTTFGCIPAFVNGNTATANAPVYLTLGRQGCGAGMGALHIWIRHGGNLAAFGVHDVESVPEFIAKVILPGTPLYWQECGTEQIRIAAHREGIGSVILGHRIWGAGPRWEVITAFSGEPWEGRLVGTIM